MNNEPKELLTARELGERYRVSSRTIRRWSKSGILPTPLGPTDATLRWYAEDIKLFEDWQALRRELQKARMDPDGAGETFDDYLRVHDSRLVERSVKPARTEG